MEMPDTLPPRWRDNVRERRACLFHYHCDRAITEAQAEAVSQELIAANGTGHWDCSVVRLNGKGTEWEFRYKPRTAKIIRMRSRSVP